MLATCRPRISGSDVRGLHAFTEQIIAIRAKCDCKVGFRRSPANCMQSAAMRVHSNSRFRQLTESDIAHLPETRVLSPCTASCVLSVVYATEESRNEKI